MPKAVVSYLFNDSSPYTSDFGVDYNLTARFVLPSEFDNSIGIGIVGAAGGQTTKIAGDVIQDLYNPCPDTNAIKPRRLTFVRANNNNISVAIGQGTNLINAATSIRDTLNAASTVPVVCVKLEGEQFANINDEVGVNVTGENVTGTPPTGGAGSYYSGVVSYTVDAPAATTQLLPVKTLTSDPTSPPPIFANVWTTCVGPFVSVYPCGGGSNYRSHRRLTVEYLVSGGKSEYRELPVVDRAQVITCAQTLAGEAGVFCIGYQGESYSRFHKLLAAPAATP